MTTFSTEDRQGFLDGIEDHISSALALCGDVSMGVTNGEQVRPEMTEQLTQALTCVRSLREQERKAGNLEDPAGERRPVQITEPELRDLLLGSMRDARLIGVPHPSDDDLGRMALRGLERLIAQLNWRDNQDEEQGASVRDGLEFIKSAEESITAAIEAAGCDPMDPQDWSELLEALAKALRSCRYAQRELAPKERRRHGDDLPGEAKA